MADSNGKISAKAVNALREKTGLPMMDCKKALQEAGGDEQQAMEILRGQFGKVMAKRAENPTEEGRIFVAAKEDGSAAAMVELQCESAPVAANDEFNALGKALAEQMLNGPGVSSVAELLSQPAPGQPGKTLQQLFEETVNKIREKLVVARVTRVSGPVGWYIHHDGKTAVLLQADGQDGRASSLRDVAMHVAALKPNVTRVEELDPAVVQQERARLAAEARATGKPENIIDKIVDGRMKLFYRDEAGVLTEQPFAKDDSKTVSQVLAEQGLKAKSFTLWVLGR
jgi:elongation factor Ts